MFLFYVMVIRGLFLHYDLETILYQPGDIRFFSLMG